MRLAVDMTALRGGVHDPVRARVLDLLRPLVDAAGSDEVLAVLPAPRDSHHSVAALDAVRDILPRRCVVVCPETPVGLRGRSEEQRQAVLDAVAVSSGARALVVPVDAGGGAHSGAGRHPQLPRFTVVPGATQRANVATLAQAWPDDGTGRGSVVEVVRAAWEWARDLSDPELTGRRTLALVSAWPPARSGVADYAAATVSALEQHYDVSVVSDTDPTTGRSLSREEFQGCWWQFDRVLYHVGNSVHHSLDLELLAEAPGCVIVHDAVLWGALHGTRSGLGHPEGVPGLLADDGGAPPRGELDLRGLRAALAPALGIVVHSTHALDVLRQGGVTTTATAVTRLAVAQARTPRSPRRPDPGRRSILGHFGFVNPFKGADLLVDAAALLTAQGRPCEVVLVGEIVSEELRRSLQRRANELGVPLTVTGFVAEDVWERWLSTVDCAVQLRPRSHGESSAALGELLAAGVPVLCTDGGAFAEIPDGVVRHVAADGDARAVADALERLLEPEEAARLGRSATAFAQACTPEAWAADVAKLVERAYDDHLGLAWADAAATLPPVPGSRELFELPGGSRRVFRPWASDVSVYAGTSFFSGIQRVTTRLHHELTELLDSSTGSLYPARVTEELAGPPHSELARDPFTWRPAVPLCEAEWLLCIDLNVRLARHREELLAARSRGMRLAVVVYDIIPVLNPQWFPPELGDVGFGAWLRCILDIADLVIVNSAATFDELRDHVSAHPPRRDDRLDLALVPWGWDLSTAEPLHEDRPREANHFLMVGTVEPRKGHADVLDAAEALWSAGSTIRVTVVGRRGWLVDDVIHRMERLERSEPRFRWVEGGTDRELEELYTRCTAVVMASYAEGFGLPVVEAALRGCPVVVRDIPVLREVGGAEATYFAADGSDLRRVLADTAERANRGPLPRRPLDERRTWAEVAHDLAELLCDERAADTSWSPRTASWSTAARP